MGINQGFAVISKLLYIKKIISININIRDYNQLNANIDFINKIFLNKLHFIINNII